jgi:hypothetical protein
MKPRRLRQTDHVACIGDRKGVMIILLRKPEGKT